MEDDFINEPNQVSISTETSALDNTLSRVVKSQEDENGNSQTTSVAIGSDDALTQLSKKGIDDAFLTEVQEARYRALQPNSWITDTGDWDLLNVEGRPAVYSQVSPVYQSTYGHDWLGKSQFDTHDQIYLSKYSMHDIDDQAWMFTDIRAKNQGAPLKIAAGVGKGAINAGATFIEGTIGLLNGVGQCIYNALSDTDAPVYAGLYDNYTANKLEELRQSMQDWMPNYTTRDERLNPLALRNLFSANTLSEQVQNLGFMVGAYYSGAVWTKTLGAITRGLSYATPKAIKTTFDKVNSQLGKNFLGRGLQSTVEFGTKTLLPSATMSYGEAATEATGAISEYMASAINAMESRLDREFQSELNSIKNEISSDLSQQRDQWLNMNGLLYISPENMTKDQLFTYKTIMSEIDGDYDRILNRRASELRDAYELKRMQAREKISQEANIVGGDVFGKNMIVLSGTNIVAFPTLLGRSMFNLRGSDDLTSPLWTKKISGKITGNVGNLRQTLMSRTVPQFLKGITRRGLSEGFEEGAQGVISSAAIDRQISKQQSAYDLYGDAYLTSGLEFYDKYATRAFDTLNSITDYVESDSGKKEMLLGAISGVIGIPVSYKTTQNSDGSVSKKLTFLGEMQDLWQTAKSHSSRVSDMVEALNYFSTQGNETFAYTKEGMLNNSDKVANMLFTMSQSEFWDNALKAASENGNLADAITAEQQKFLNVVAGLSATGQLNGFLDSFEKTIAAMSDEEFDAFRQNVQSYMGDTQVDSFMSRKEARQSIKDSVKKMRTMSILYSNALRQEIQERYDAGFSPRQISHLANMRVTGRLQQMNALSMICSIIYDKKFDKTDGENDATKDEIAKLRETINNAFGDDAIKFFADISKLNVESRIIKLNDFFQGLGSEKLLDRSSSNPFSANFIISTINTVNGLIKKNKDDFLSSTIDYEKQVSALAAGLKAVTDNIFSRTAKQIKQTVDDAQIRLDDLIKIRQNKQKQRRVAIKEGNKASGESLKQEIIQLTKDIKIARSQLRQATSSYVKSAKLTASEVFLKSLPSAKYVIDAIDAYQQSNTAENAAKVYDAFNKLLNDNSIPDDVRSEISRIQVYVYRNGKIVYDNFSNVKLKSAGQTPDATDLKAYSAILSKCDALMSSHTRLQSFFTAASFKAKYDLYYKKCISEIKNRKRIAEFKDIYDKLLQCKSLKDMQEEYWKYVSTNPDNADIARQAICLLASLYTKKPSFFDKLLHKSLSEDLVDVARNASLIYEKLLALDILTTRIICSQSNPDYREYKDKIDIEELIAVLHNFAFSENCTDCYSLLRADVGSLVTKNKEITNSFYAKVSIDVGKDLIDLEIHSAKRSKDGESQTSSTEEPEDSGFTGMSDIDKKRMIISLLLKNPAKAISYVFKMAKGNHFRQVMDWLIGTGCFGQKYANVRAKLIESVMSFVIDSKEKLNTIVDLFRDKLPKDQLNVVLDLFAETYFKIKFRGYGYSDLSIDNLGNMILNGAITVKEISEIPAPLLQRMMNRLFSSDQHLLISKSIDPIINQVVDLKNLINKLYSERTSNGVAEQSEKDLIEDLIGDIDKITTEIQSALKDGDTYSALQRSSLLLAKYKDVDLLRYNDNYSSVLEKSIPLNASINSLIEQIDGFKPNLSEVLRKLPGFSDLFSFYTKIKTDATGNIVSKISASGQEEFNFGIPHSDNVNLKYDKSAGFVELSEEQLTFELNDLLTNSSNKPLEEILSSLLSYERAALSKFIERYANEIYNSYAGNTINDKQRIVDISSLLIAAYVYDENTTANYSNAIEQNRIYSFSEMPSSIVNNYALEKLWNIAKFVSEVSERNENKEC